MTEKSEKNLKSLLTSDVASTITGGLTILFVGTIPSLMVVFSNASDLVKTTFIGLSLGGGSVAGAVIGRGQPTAMRDVLINEENHQG